MNDRWIQTLRLASVAFLSVVLTFAGFPTSAFAADASKESMQVESTENEGDHHIPSDALEAAEPAPMTESDPTISSMQVEGAIGATDEPNLAIESGSTIEEPEMATESSETTDVITAADGSMSLLSGRVTANGIESPPHPVSIHDANERNGLSTQGYIPSSYDSRSGGNVTPARFAETSAQSSAFATISSIESSAIKRGSATQTTNDNPLRSPMEFNQFFQPSTLSLSTWHLHYHLYHCVADPLGNTAGDSIQLSGLNYFQAGAKPPAVINTLANGYGPVYEDAAPYTGNAYEIPAANAYSPAALRVSDARVIPIDEESRDDAKQAIMRYGAIYTSIMRLNSCFNNFSGNEYSYFYNGGGNGAVSHYVSIIGWNDSFPASNFNGVNGAKPNANGAWLVKDSDTTGCGSTGYYWISYQSKANKPDGEVAYAFDTVTSAKFDNAYQYDGTNNYYHSLKLASGSSVAQVFTSKASDAEILNSLSIQLNDVDVNLDVDVYRYVEGSDPTNGELCASAQRTTDYAGLYTIDLPSPVHLSKGTRFSVVVTLSHADESDVIVPIDSSNEFNFGDGSSLSFTNHTERGQSFTNVNNTWYDLHKTYGTINACVRLKAFTKNNTGSKISMDQCDVTVPNQKYTGSAHKPQPEVWYQNSLLMKDVDYRVSGYAGSINAGTGYVYLVGQGRFTGNRTVQFTIEKESIKACTIMPVADEPYNGNEHAPEPTISLGSKTLDLGTDYTLSYRNNRQAGTATITITGKGNLKDSKNILFAITRSPANFPDVKPGSWYYDVVRRASSLGFISGYDNGLFGPDDLVTRGQAAVIIWNLAGRPEAGAGVNAFHDVNNKAYYYEAVRWASSAGVVSGYGNGMFGPSNYVTREELATIISNFASKVIEISAQGSPQDYASMSDASAVSLWAGPAIGWCFNKGILSGSDGRILPQGNTRRSETAKMLVSLWDIIHA